MSRRSELRIEILNSLVPVSFLGIILLSMYPSVCVHASELPIGIPVPPFGFVETHEMYASEPGYTIGASGPYTHYVDNTNPSCDDLVNDGTLVKPRCSIPTSLEAGDVVEVHGGPYRTSGVWDFTLNGARNAPIFIHGIDDGGGYPILDSDDSRNGRVLVNGSYAVFENFRLDTTGAWVGTSFPSDHLAIRNLDINWHQKTCVIISADYTVVSESEIHHCHDPVEDRHGIQVNQGTKYTWILYNDIHHNSGNGIQYTHQAEFDLPNFVFIGGNHIHSDREVGISSKWVDKTVVSSNVIHSYRPSQVGVNWCYDDNSGCMTPKSATNGPGIILGSDGYPLEKWVIYNIIYDTNHCIRVEKTIKGRIIGNVCANIQGAGIMLEKLAEDLYIVNNTFFNTGIDGQSGVIQQYWRDAFDLNVQNNLILSPRGRALWFEQRSVMNDMEFNNNLFWNGGSDFSILWLNDVVQVGTIGELRDLMQSDLAEMSNNLVMDPGMSVRDTPSPVMEDFIPPDNSPLVNAGSDVLLILDAEFKASFGAGVTIIPSEWSDHNFDIGAVPSGFSVDVVTPRPPDLH